MSKTPDLSNVDFGDHKATVSLDKLEQLTLLVNTLEEAEVAAAEAAAVAAQTATRLKGILEHELPDLMLELNQPILHTSDGRKIEIKDIVRGTLPAPMRPIGHKWLIDNGHAGVIKSTVEVAFAAVEAKESKELLTTMTKEFGANARQVMKIEGATMTAFVKKQLKRESAEGYEGPVMPRNVFTVAEFKHAAVSKKKK